MDREMLRCVFHRGCRLVGAAALAVPFALAVACDEPEVEAELAAEDARFDGADEHVAGPADAVRELAAAGDPQLVPPEAVCCSIDWSSLFTPRVRLSTVSSEGCAVYNWPPTVTARVAYTVYHEYGSPGPASGLAAWMAPNTVQYLAVSSLNASHCDAYTVP